MQSRNHLLPGTTLFVDFVVQIIFERLEFQCIYP